MSAVMKDSSDSAKLLAEQRKLEGRRRAQKRTHIRLSEAMKAVRRVFDDTRMREVCRLIAGGLSTARACKEVGIAESTMYAWNAQFPESKAMFDAARVARSDKHAEDVVRISDLRQDPKRLAVRMRSRMWHAARMNPRQYGEQTEVKHSGTVTLAALVALAVKLREEGNLPPEAFVPSKPIEKKP